MSWPAMTSSATRATRRRTYGNLCAIARSLPLRCIHVWWVSTVETACEAAAVGVGLTRAFSYHVSSFVASGMLTTVLDGYRPAALPVSFVYASSRFLPIKLRAFLDFATPRLKAQLAK